MSDYWSYNICHREALLTSEQINFAIDIFSRFGSYQPQGDISVTDTKGGCSISMVNPDQIMVSVSFKPIYSDVNLQELSFGLPTFLFEEARDPQQFASSLKNIFGGLCVKLNTTFGNCMGERWAEFSDCLEANNRSVCNGSIPTLLSWLNYFPDNSIENNKLDFLRSAGAKIESLPTGHLVYFSLTPAAVKFTFLKEINSVWQQMSTEPNHKGGFGD